MRKSDQHWSDVDWSLFSSDSVLGVARVIRVTVGKPVSAVSFVHQPCINFHCSLCRRRVYASPVIFNAFLKQPATHPLSPPLPLSSTIIVLYRRSFRCYQTRVVYNLPWHAFYSIVSIIPLFLLTISCPALLRLATFHAVSLSPLFVFCFNVACGN